MERGRGKEMVESSSILRLWQDVTSILQTDVEEELFLLDSLCRVRTDVHEFELQMRVIKERRESLYKYSQVFDFERQQRLLLTLTILPLNL